MQFYLLTSEKDKRSYHPLYVWYSEKYRTQVTNPLPRCPECGRSLGYKFKPPYFVDLEVYKNYYADVTPTISGQLFVSQSFKDCYEKSGLTGLVAINPVTVSTFKQKGPAKRAKLPPLPNFYIADPQPLGLATDHELSSTEFYIGDEPTCKYCRFGGTMRYKKIILDDTNWKGDDIFRLLSIGGEIAVDQKFKEWYDANKFTGCTFTPTEEDSCDFVPGKTPQQYYDQHFKK
ncbi:MAG: hypothetical protein Q4G68_10710 [Planctomycetia bacterium]|nr:hypothetical protein [Planctomycetia bacterium]